VRTEAERIHVNEGEVGFAVGAENDVLQDADNVGLLIGDRLVGKLVLPVAGKGGLQVYVKRTGGLQRAPLAAGALAETPRSIYGESYLRRFVR
jgi:hypothetical protein